MIRLLHAESLEFKEFDERACPEYAILSHTWLEEGEVSFQDMSTDLEAAKEKPGFSKIQGCCAVARRHNIDWIWVDTCCIDKTNATELSYALRSMYQWYAKSKVCLAYLSDIETKEQFYNGAPSRWFYRGWTLQELIAPGLVIFLSKDWERIGGKPGTGRDGRQNLSNNGD